MPKRRAFDFVVPGSPEEVAKRLKKKTRWRPFNFQSSILGTGGLGGRVSPSKFSVSDDTRAFFRQARTVANGTFTAEGRNTRVRGEIGMSPFMVWGMRIGFLLLIPVFLFLVASGLSEGVTAFTTSLGLMFVFVGLAMAAMGWHVSHANEGIDALDTKVREATGAPTGAAESSKVQQRKAQFESA